MLSAPCSAAPAVCWWVRPLHWPPSSAVCSCRVLDVWLLHEGQKLNDNIPSDQRATLISVDGMAYSLLMIPASPLVGAVGDAFGQAGAGLVVLGLLVAASGILIYKKQ